MHSTYRDFMAQIVTHPKAVLGVMMVLFLLLGIINSVTVPLFEAPDELWHFSFARYLALNRSLPVQPKEGTDIWLRESGQPPLYYLVAAPVVAAFDTSDFPDFVRFNVAHPAVTAHSQSHAPNVFIHTPYEAFPYQGSVLVIHLLRLLTLLWGVGTVIGVYLVGREVLPDSPGLALAAVSITAFNPHFIYISSVVNNDATVACLATFTLWLSIRLVQIPGSRKYQVVLGIILGLALLSKLSALALLGVTGLSFMITWWYNRDTRMFFTRCLVVFGLALLIAGWWYVRNWTLYGDPLGWSVWLAHAGVERLALTELLGQLPQVAERFWSPYDALFPMGSLWLLAIAMLLVVIGWIKLLVRHEIATSLFVEGVALSGVWFVVLCISLLRFMSVTPAANGRLLFPGIAAFSVLWVLGFRSVLSGRWLFWGLGGFIVGLLLLSFYSPILGIAPRYALPLVKSESVLEDAELFDSAEFVAVRLLGVRVTPDTVGQGEDEVQVTLYWEAAPSVGKASPTPPPDLRVVVRLWSAGGRLVAQHDTTPAGEVYPPDLWEPGDIIQDVHTLQLDTTSPAMCRVAVNVLAGDTELGAVTSPLILRLAAPGEVSPSDLLPLDYRLGAALDMQGYNLVYDSGRVTLALHWVVVSELSADYVLFAQLFDAAGMLVGQGDGPPLNGDYPSSYWQIGEYLTDTRTIVIPDTSSEPAYLLVGFYQLNDGARLPVVAAGGQRVTHDAIRLELPNP